MALRIWRHFFVKNRAVKVQRGSRTRSGRKKNIHTGQSFTKTGSIHNGIYR